MRLLVGLVWSACSVAAVTMRVRPQAKTPVTTRLQLPVKALDLRAQPEAPAPMAIEWRGREATRENRCEHQAELAPDVSLVRAGTPTALISNPTFKPEPARSAAPVEHAYTLPGGQSFRVKLQCIQSLGGPGSACDQGRTNAPPPPASGIPAGSQYCDATRAGCFAVTALDVDLGAEADGCRAITNRAFEFHADFDAANEPGANVTPAGIYLYFNQRPTGVSEF